MNYIIFGAGKKGRNLLRKIKKQTLFLVDNDEKKWGRLVDGIKVISLNELLAVSQEYELYVAVKDQSKYQVIRKLKENGITEYHLYNSNFYDEDKLIDESFVQLRGLTEKDHNETVQKDLIRKLVREGVDYLNDEVPLFNIIEIETINRCNGVCSFCPVNRNADTRKEKRMEMVLFENIIQNLRELNYRGRLSLFSNNEPLLDERIVELHRYVREQLPDAKIHMYTNGTLFTLELFCELIPYLDELIIDNYSVNGKLIKPNAIIKDYVEEHPELIEKVTIIMRNPNEILTTRGGNSPNRKEIVTYGDDTCILPFQQMVVRPDGKVSLCCNDALGKYTLGDLTKERIEDVWYGRKYQMIRQCMTQGRSEWGECQYCDNFSFF